MIDYAALSDSELQQLSITGDRFAEETLADRYTRLVRACARPLFLAGGDSEDLIQEGMFGLLAAIRQFDVKGGASFRTYAEHCIRSRLLSAVKSASRMKHFPLNDGMSLSNSQKIPVRSYRQIPRFFGAVRRIWFWPERARKNFTASFRSVYLAWNGRF